jgi:hypothetical protein
MLVVLFVLQADANAYGAKAEDQGGEDRNQEAEEIGIVPGYDNPSK